MVENGAATSGLPLLRENDNRHSGAGSSRHGGDVVDPFHDAWNQRFELA